MSWKEFGACKRKLEVGGVGLLEALCDLHTLLEIVHGLNGSARTESYGYVAKIWRQTRSDRSQAIETRSESVELQRRLQKAENQKKQTASFYTQSRFRIYSLYWTVTKTLTRA
ncbi:hypothetical protein RRG08_038790 [Elysia crispata]|uniref:Uncharacterized protein n=1 Tax=Elysia crispata TaxID=231223 RepID=A0AAE0YUI6_9GAST|nr:hypothetical protein RRG08_038790 [Elysia crispata]